MVFKRTTPVSALDLDPSDIPDAIQVVNHGANAGTTRPSGVAVVYWIGSVYPTNSIATDLWYDTTASGVSVVTPVDDLYLTARELSPPASTPSITGAVGSGTSCG